MSWSSKKQHLVSRSSTEAEYREIASLVAKLLWINCLLIELRVSLPLPVMYCDNAGVVLMAANPELHSRSKHFELDLHFIYEHVAEGHVRVSHIPGDAQVADVMTKTVSSAKFVEF